MLEQLQEFLAPIIALLIAGLWTEVRNRITSRKSTITINSSDAERKKFDAWRDGVKRHTYRQFNIIKAQIYVIIEHIVEDRLRDGQKTDTYKDRHNIIVPMPLARRGVQLHEDFRTVIEDVRSWVRSELITEPLNDMSEKEIEMYSENLTNTVYRTIKNDLTKSSCKSDVLEDIFLEFNYGDLLDIIQNMIRHSVRTR